MAVQIIHEVVNTNTEVKHSSEKSWSSVLTLSILVIHLNHESTTFCNWILIYNKNTI